MTSRVIEYITEEVYRQGHNVSKIDGWERVSYMLNAWVYATHRIAIKPCVDDARILGKLIEPHKNAEGFRTCDVTVGMKETPNWGRVPELLVLLFEQRDKLTPLEFYKGFEDIHPFVDGNGRTGKILLNWLNLTLTNPVFPPNNFWGREIQNP